MAEFAERVKSVQLLLDEDKDLYRGIFWVPDVDDVQSSQLYFQIPCDSDGNVSPDFNIPTQMSSKGTDNYNHKNVWNSLPKKLTYGYDFNYYPRGRIEINRGVATIYASPHIPSEDLMSWLIDKFNLTAHNGIKKVRYIADGSDHYKCHLDE